ncbi:Helicase conserved C-terminal domain containing protein, putative [Plasmodium malariae]|nr:Helicase conserved C-terminal domain containing protein, putative [Plasmodium malariae]
MVDYKNLKKYVNFMFISTNLLYRGINCTGFTTIINFDMPSTPTEYVHRCGRIGRINNKGAVINIFEKKDKRSYRKRIFKMLNVHVYDVDCYMNNLFTLKGNEKNS